MEKVPVPQHLLLTFKDPKTQFQGTHSASVCSLVGRYDNPIPTRFLAPIDCSKIPAQELIQRNLLCQPSRKRVMVPACHTNSLAELVS
jgi:hypothetical protein